MEKPKILMIGRHGSAPQKKEGGSIDSLVDSTIPQLYDSVGVPLREYGVEEGRAFLIHSKARRTRITGEAILAGAFGYQRPESVEELAKIYNRDNLSFITQDNRLNLRNPHCNKEIYKNLGAAAVIDYWLANPEAREHNGEPITPYKEIERGMHLSLSNAIKILKSYNSPENDLGIFVTHGTLVEPALLTLINTRRVNPISSISEIGGPIDMGEFAKLEFMRDQKIGDRYGTVATLEIKGQKYDVYLDIY